MYRANVILVVVVAVIVTIGGDAIGETSGGASSPSSVASLKANVIQVGGRDRWATFIRQTLDDLDLDAETARAAQRVLDSKLAERASLREQFSAEIEALDIGSTARPDAETIRKQHAIEDRLEAAWRTNRAETIEALGELADGRFRQTIVRADLRDRWRVTNLVLGASVSPDHRGSVLVLEEWLATHPAISRTDAQAVLRVLDSALAVHVARAEETIADARAAQLELTIKMFGLMNGDPSLPLNDLDGFMAFFAGERSEGAGLIGRLRSIVSSLEINIEVAVRRLRGPEIALDLVRAWEDDRYPDVAAGRAQVDRVIDICGSMPAAQGDLSERWAAFEKFSRTRSRVIDRAQMREIDAGVDFGAAMALPGPGNYPLPPLEATEFSVHRQILIEEIVSEWQELLPEEQHEELFERLEAAE